MTDQIELSSDISRIEYEIDQLVKQKRELQKQREQALTQRHVELIQQLAIENALTERNLKMLLTDFASEIKGLYAV